MKHIAKPKMTKKQRAALILAIAFLVLLAICIPVSVILSNKGNDPVKIEQPEILEGEARQNGSTLAYPVINSINQISYISIDNQKGEFGFAKLDGEKTFTMYYVDGEGERRVYYPAICAEDPSFDYSQLYAIQTNDGFSKYTMLDYLCTGLQMAYFAERIPVAENEEERVKQLQEYGLTEDKASTVRFSYVDELGNEKNRTVTIGAKNISGNGYYFTVDDRQYVYASTGNYYDYAVTDHTSFLKALVVAPGLAADKGFGPYLTTGYYQWKNELCDAEGEAVKPDSKVIVFADRIYTGKSNDSAFSGLSGTGYRVIELDLEKLKASEDYKSLVAMLIGAKNGAQGNELVVTAPNKSNYITFGEAASKKYGYTVTAVEAILTDTADITEAGAVAGDAYNFIKVAYTSTLDGEAICPHVRYAVVDLTSSAIPGDAVAKLRSTPVGQLSEDKHISFEVDYTRENAYSKRARYIITDIVSVYDKDRKEIKKIAGDSIVTYRYSIEVEGEVIETNSFTLDLSAITEGNDLAIKNALVGKGPGKDVNLSFDSYVTAYYEHFMEFETYKISRIDYFVTRKLITAFRFQNSSKRDPYYGESLYENLLENEYKLYGLNASACESVVKILGGLSDESTSATAVGLTGTNVVATGLTPEVLKKYGLYANTIYFELPRNIKAYSGEGSVTTEINKDLDDYTYLSTLGFTLYVSEVDPVTNMRYVASDMYDIVTKIPADTLEFLNHNFESFWARRNMMLMDIYDIDSLNLEFLTSDLKGEYFFDLIHEKIKYETSSFGTTADYNKITVFTTPKGECTPNKLTEYMKAKGYSDGLSITELYESLYPNDPELKRVYPDSLGTSYFKQAVRMIYLTAYVDVMPEAERADAMRPENMVMRMTLKIKSSAHRYVYELYRADDRRVLVSIYQIDANGARVTEPVSAFYISTFAYKKIVTNFVGILNGEKITPDVGYSDENK